MVESIFIAGLGGQGIVTLASLITDLAADSGCRVSLFNAKGMAQRGGRVTAEIRYTAGEEECFGPRIGTGQADILIGMELGETASSQAMLRPQGLLLLADVALAPAEVTLKKQAYPDGEEVKGLFKERTKRIVCAPPPARAQNLFMLGLLVSRSERFSAENAEALIARRLTLRKGREEGLESFRQGVAYDGL
jgi:Pyruvate/2-oxoacid:ferredoxin oxidoreductase gamma subunit